jgi:predicted RNA polymerase sigma factor
MRDYPLLPAVAGDLNCSAGNHDEARQHFLRAAALTENRQQRSTMQHRAALCASHHEGSD